MKITIGYELGHAVGVEKLERFGIDEHQLRYKGYKAELNVKRWSPKMLREFAALVKPHSKIRGVNALARDLEAWAKVIEADPSETRAKKVEHMAFLLKKLLKDVPQHRLYQKNDDAESWDVYYVSDIVYHKPERQRYDGQTITHPPYLTVEMKWIELGQEHEANIRFEKEECVGRSPHEMLVTRGYIPATEELEAMYEAEDARYSKTVTNIGMQLLVTGTVTDDVDGNPRKDTSNWWWRRTNSIRVDSEGEPSRMVVDVFVEDETKAEKANRKYRDRQQRFDFWEDTKFTKEDEDDLDDSDDEVDLDTPEERLDEVQKSKTPIPTHPTLILFDLKRHLRVKAHLSQTTEYGYDPKVASKLILPDEVRDLVEMLISHNTAFSDVVKGKSGGAIILCAGVPGTGKTLTSEVYSEVMERPLYSVQASQLGSDPTELESELLKTFQRAKRWNAILLIDEADVYVRRRGDDLVQNSIVGVFLRVLEYYSGVMFMTTNRADLVDDAIASRCVARIDYGIPPPSDQAKIWRILARQAAVDLPNETIADIVLAYPNLSGRDIKNLVKLATMVARTKKVSINVETIRFVKSFKPTDETDIPKHGKHAILDADAHRAKIIAELAKPERRARTL